MTQTTAYPTQQRSCSNNTRNPRHRQREVGYQGQHDRVRAVWGTPSRCDACGREGPGIVYEWALAPFVQPEDLRTSPQGHAFSIRIEDYWRLCRSCHHRSEPDLSAWYAARFPGRVAS